MFLVPLARRWSLLRPLRTVSVTGAGNRACLSVCCWRAFRRLPLGHVGGRSSISNKVRPVCAASRCLSTGSHSEDGQLIYKGNLGMAVRGVKVFSYSTSGASLILMPQVLLKTGLGFQSLAFQALFCSVIGFFTFLTPVLLHMVTKGYVVRLYHNAERDTYTAITYSIFLTEKRTVFHQKQVRIPAISKMFTTFYADKTGLLVNPDLFPIAHHYNHLMGYDKPFFFVSDELERPDKS